MFILRNNHLYRSTDKAAIQNITSSTSKSYIGQTVTLKCVSDGFPTPTITWIRPDGKEVNKVTSKVNTVTVMMSGDQDFGFYTCKAENGLGAVTRKLQLQEIESK